jgi:hypothetical protein
MARKGLQAMGVATTAAPATSFVGDADDVVPAASVDPERPRSADEEFADQLDTAFEDYDALPRAEAPPRREESLDSDAVAGSRRTSERPVVRSSRLEFDDDDDEPVRRGPHPLLWVLVALIGAVLLGFLVLSLLGGNGGGGTVGRPTSEPTSALATPAGGEPTVAAPGTGEQPAQTTPTTPEQPTAAPTGTGEQPAQPTALPPGTGEQPAQPGVPPEQANPAPVEAGATLQASSWSYSFPNANYAIFLGNQAGGQTAQGEYVHVLMFVTNNTGTAQPIPADFFVLKDSQGRVFNAQPQVSSALVQRGINADLGMQDNVPANGSVTSVYLVFDVAQGASDLVLFARSNPAQGWRLTPVR